MGYRIAVVGATGNVGREMLQVLAERQFPLAEIAAVEKQHGIYAAKVRQPGSADGYTMDHSAAALLFDRAGKFVATIAPDEPDAAALAKLKRAVG